jgi:hypothetical protein
MDKKTYIMNLKNNKMILQDFIMQMTDTEIQNRYKDYWTIREHIEHLVISQNILLERIKIFINEQNPIIKPYSPNPSEENTYKAMKIDELTSKFASIRNEQIRLIKKASNEVWKR